ncbi:TonB-dependent receptor [Subsaximicrobium wynnwilliamsii]|uniref:TonB-dependent receptor n=1 Tax=Subsaximicrobium wynnwilliamsii TaxID=291179 RepID=A0A5C6ZGJ4_9FLAO|nr:TonB-dependent receptor plug domain-containing protein [Subsaximicrobium wynnwilliamsii]TXD83055.1 TonB-dependent receptor [Subsaximicrobium wynnwilliamsii]TXD88799.1 TonB-dependent receptor [Subsaximicrobium wynnwilliamsii]TXE02872.1 TonB-dependent receptor [Subsaximicrobium wynnwilliamsii]
MKKGILCCFIVFFCGLVYAQQENNDVKKDTTILNEIIVVGQRKLSNYRQEKTLSSIDDYLEKSNKVTMIKRGGYAWEPALNNMNSERLNITIDGMQIFGACTDKMDPITSYVDVSNLDKVSIGSGQSGTENGHNVGGGIDLQLAASKFHGAGLITNVDLGYETNGNYRIRGMDLEYSGQAFFLNFDGIYRKSDNYKAGGDKEVLYSQFEKFNLSLQTGYKLSEHQTLEAHAIYDKATNVGYPALPMDVSLAEALITSITHSFKADSAFIKSLESKLYFNTITHIMDDSQRPEVPIRMDMPGWSDTYGFYSKASIQENKHNISLNLNGFYNRSLAEMTMYPNDPNQSAMFMYTWPDIRTLYSGVYAKDDFQMSNNETLSVSSRLGYHRNKIAEEVGLGSLQIFYPQLKASKSRVLSSFAANYLIKKPQHDVSFGLAYGERAPSVSEGYGFFLFNSFDNYDYIGNPTLANEKAIEANLKANYHKNRFHIGFEASYFHLMDYIIGDIAETLSPMTIGATGVRIYKALSNASIFDVYLNSSYKLSEALAVNATLGYNRGRGSNDENLPLIKPLSFMAEFNYNTPKFNAALQLEANGNQSNYSGFYGEDETPAYGVLNLNFGNLFYMKTNKVVFKYGVENVLDTNYSTFADWNNIPRQGRNVYANLSVVLQ